MYTSFVSLISLSLGSSRLRDLPFLPGPPGPPGDCRVTEVTETTASVSWSPGTDNYSPILSYAIQARTPFFLGWQAVTTSRLVFYAVEIQAGCLVSFLNRLFLRCLLVPELLGGKQLSATVIDLSPWVEYEFRVLATNSIGTGEPSRPSKKARTKETRTCQKLIC